MICLSSTSPPILLPVNFRASVAGCRYMVLVLAWHLQMGGAGYLNCITKISWHLHIIVKCSTGIHSLITVGVSNCMGLHLWHFPLHHTDVYCHTWIALSHAFNQHSLNRCTDMHLSRNNLNLASTIRRWAHSSQKKNLELNLALTSKVNM